MVLRGPIVLAVLLCVLPLTQSVASAEPIQITAGLFAEGFFTGLSGAFSGADFRLEPFEVREALASCKVCETGELVDLGGTVDFANATAFESSDAAIFLIAERAFAVTGGRLQFAVDPVIAPDVVLHGEDPISTAFRMMGFLTGVGPSGTARVDVVGTGVVTAFFGGSPEGEEPVPGVAVLHETLFAFKDTEPVPEPGTIVLLASGLIIIGRGLRHGKLKS